MNELEQDELEQLLRRTLADRAVEAPPATDLLSRVRVRLERPRRSWVTPALVGLATAAVVVVAGISVPLIGTHRSPAERRQILAKQHEDGARFAPAIVVSRAAETVLTNLASEAQNPHVQWVRTTADQLARIDPSQPSTTNTETVYVIQVVAPIACNGCRRADGATNRPTGQAMVLVAPASPTSQLPSAGIVEAKPLDLGQLGPVGRFQFPYGASRATPPLTGLTVNQATAVAKAAGFTAAVNLPVNERIDPTRRVTGQIDAAGALTRLHVVVLILNGQ